MSLKIAIAQINATVGDLAGNAARILDFAQRAKAQGADLVLTPELVLCGYPPVLVGIRPTSPLFHFLAHIQEEVHRFAVSFHRQKRSKAFIHSELEQIEGIGDKTIRTLLQHFRSVAKVKAAPAEELSALVGPAKAKKIRAFFEK